MGGGNDNYKDKVYNKSFIRSDSYEEEDSASFNIFSVSFDDTIKCFKDIQQNKDSYESIFDNSTLAWMKEIHKKYGVVISCYVMYEDDGWSLEECTDKYRNEFLENSNWLRFGFHSIDGSSYEIKDIKDDYDKLIKELIRIVGEESIDNVIRLQGFQGSKENVQLLANDEYEPIVGLYTADDNRQSYYLESDISNYIYCHDIMYDKENGVYLISTDLRVEYIHNVQDKLREFLMPAWNNQLGDLIVFSHEWALNVQVKEDIDKICRYALENEYKFIFYEDIIKKIQNND